MAVIFLLPLTPLTGTFEPPFTWKEFLPGDSRGEFDQYLLLIAFEYRDRIQRVQEELQLEFYSCIQRPKIQNINKYINNKFTILNPNKWGTCMNLGRSINGWASSKTFSLTNENMKGVGDITKILFEEGTSKLSRTKFLVRQK